MRKLINDQDEEIDGKIDRRGWRNCSSTFESLLVERGFV
jgi:hypothetical protein